MWEFFTTEPLALDAKLCRVLMESNHTHTHTYMADTLSQEEDVLLCVTGVDGTGFQEAEESASPSTQTPHR